MKREDVLKHYREKYLDDNHWRERDWGEQDVREHIELMSNGTRDFLRCPSCNAVGTFKPRYNPAHGMNARYYVCKWCGYGRDQFGEWQYWPDNRLHVWGCWTDDSGPTPKQMVGKLDPWCG